MARELKENGAWVPLTPVKSEITHKGLNRDVGSVENPQLFQNWGILGQVEKESGNWGYQFGRDQEFEKNFNRIVDGAKNPEDCIVGVARKSDFMVSGKSDFMVSGDQQDIVSLTKYNSPHQETIEVDVPFAWKEGGSQRHNNNLGSTEASRMPKNRAPKRGRNNGIDLNTMPRKRLKMKSYRPKVQDNSKLLKPSTPKPRTPKCAKYVKKDRLKTAVDPTKDVDLGAVGDYNKGSCRQKLDFDMENCSMNQDLKVSDGITIRSEVEPKLHSASRFSSLRVYQRIFRPNECLKNSRKLGPNCPNIFKKTRMRRQRATVFDKFIIRIVSVIPPARKQRRAARNLYSIQKGRKKKSWTYSQRQKSINTRASTEKKTRKAIKRPRVEKCTLNLTWMVDLKRKRSKSSTRRRDLSSFINDLSRIQVSEAFLMKASSIRTKNTAGDKFAACVEVQDEGIHSLATKIFIEQQELPRDNMVSCNGRIQIYPTESGDCMLGVEMDLPGLSSEIDMLNYQVVKGQSLTGRSMNGMGSFSDKLLSVHNSEYKYGISEFPACLQQQEHIIFECMERSLESDIVTPNLVGPHNEQREVLSTRDYGAFTQALVDFAVQRMEGLHIDDGCKQLVVQDQNAHGAIVPSEGKLDLSKRRKALPKVDLDDETMRVWNLMMENGGSEYTEQEDDDKAKYWKQQREIFCGRVDSFIARMRLIQGDRRFSPWKGSVVDSVVGAFLTQNVSDHLSSSAFMSLAARYPPPSVSEHNGYDDRSDCVTHEIEQVKISEPPTGECEELLMIDKHPSSNPHNQVEVDHENGNKASSQTESTSGRKKGKFKGKQENTSNWDDLRKSSSHGRSRSRMGHTIDSVNWEAVRQAPVEEVAKVITGRGMNNILAGRIKDFLERLVRDHGSIDLEWLRDIEPDKAKEYLLSITGLGLKSVECVRLLALHHHAFPVDTNVGRILVRLGWVPLQPLPENTQIHLLNQYPLEDTIQKYIWPRIYTCTGQTLYECHCQMIACGKTFCTKRRPNCNACPLRGECRHFASACASSKLHLEGPPAKSMATEPSVASDQGTMVHGSPPKLSYFDDDFLDGCYNSHNCEPTVEIPASPEPACIETLERDIEDFDFESDDHIPTIKLDSEEFRKNVLSFMGREDVLSKALVPLPEAASIPNPKLKSVGRLQTVHHVYELPDSHPLLTGFEERELEDPCPYLLAIWATNETTNSSQGSGETTEYQNDQIVRGTILIPCRTANRGAFPLNGTYFQVNEVFADQESSQCPIAVPREWIWNLRRRALYCGTSITSICRGMSMEEIQYCFWRGFICIRGFDTKNRAPRPLSRRFHDCKTRPVDND